VTRKWCHLTGSHLEVAVEGLKLGFCVSLSFYRATTRRKWQSQHRNWRQCPHVTGSDPEVTSFHRMPLGIGCRRPKVGFCVSLSSYRAVTRRRWLPRDRKLCDVTSRDRKWPEVTSFERKSPGSAVESRRLGFCVWAPTGL